MIIDVDVVSDFVCPWCFIGKVRLSKAVAKYELENPGSSVRMNWLPYFLNPDTPIQGEPYRPFLEAKFGGAKAVDALFERVRGAVGTEGPAFAFERIRLRVNTLRAHRLVYRAQALGWRPEVVRAMVDALFVAYFQEARDIGDIGTLADIAAASGGRREDVLAYLSGEDDAAAVKKMALQLGHQGVSGVPFFVFNRRLAVSGAQSEAALGAALIQSISDERA